MVSAVAFVVVWAGFVAALMSWQTSQIRKAVTPENRARLWQKKRAKYNFDENTGEWDVIKSNSEAGSVIVDSKPRGKRIVNEYEYRKSIILMGWCLYIMSGFGLAAFVTGLLNGSTLGLLPLALFGWVFPLQVWTVTRFCRADQKWGFGLVIDPPAREWVSTPFGPVVGAAPGQLDASPSVDLGYKPNQ